MTRVLLLGAALIGALVLAALASAPPPPRPASAPPAAFSAERAMADVRAIARAPHITGSAEAARVRTYLLGRMESLGLEDIAAQPVPLSARARQRLRAWEGVEGAEGVNLVGVLPGRDRAATAVLILAHHDTAAGSPGAADDAAGVAAILETVRALRAGPAGARDLVVLFSDAEELDRDGALAFISAHPLAGRIGSVVNLEARGSGGRALMFETGPDNGAGMALFRDAVHQPTAHSLAVLIYTLMPNSSDFTVARNRGLQGFNFAFMGRAGLYHSPLATPDRLDVGSLQHLGGQALDLTRALTAAPSLPAPAPDAVFSDVLGLGLVLYPAVVGWAIVAVIAVLLAFAGFRARRAGALRLVDAWSGVARALSLFFYAVLALELGNRLSGAGPAAEYYDRLAAHPRLEAQAVAIGLAVLLSVLSLRGPTRRWLAIFPAILLALAATGIGGLTMDVAVVASLAATLSIASPRTPPAGLGAWVGALSIVFILSAAVQAVAPTAAPLFAWPLLVAAAGAAFASAVDPRLKDRRALSAIAGLAVLGGAQALAMAHLAFLGVGHELAPAMAVFVLLIAALVWPLAAGLPGRILPLAAAVLLVAGVGLALWVRLDPPADSRPTYVAAPQAPPAPAGA